MRKQPWAGSAASYLKMCLDRISRGVKTGYAPNIHDAIEYQMLGKKEKALIDNIFKTTFDVDGVYD